VTRDPGGRTSVEGMRIQLSRPAVAVAVVSLAVGLLSGVRWYLGRSDQVERQVPGTEAWIPHAVVALVVAIWFGVAALRSPLGLRVVFGPLGRPIAARIAATFRTMNPLRWLVVAFLVFFEAYLCWRIGEQVFAGLDPSFVHNAWGGPSYAGAMLCHYLDSALLLTICHVLIRAATVPSADQQHQHAQ
jgi:hypothetical protein